MPLFIQKTAGWGVARSLKPGVAEAVSLPLFLRTAGLKTALLFPQPKTGKPYATKRRGFRLLPAGGPFAVNGLHRCLAVLRGSRDRGRGFTLIELLVIVLIIGVLSSVALPQYEKAVNKARVQELFILGNYLKNQEEIYRLANGAYTDDFSVLGIDVPAGGKLSADNKTLSVKHGSFTLLTNIDRVLASYRGGSVFVSLSFMLDTLHSARLCCAYSQDGYKGEALCRGLGGVNPRNACISEGESGCRCFELP